MSSMADGRPPRRAAPPAGPARLNDLFSARLSRRAFAGGAVAALLAVLPRAAQLTAADIVVIA